MGGRKKNVSLLWFARGNAVVSAVSENEITDCGLSPG